MSICCRGIGTGGGTGIRAQQKGRSMARSIAQTLSLARTLSFSPSCSCRLFPHRTQSNSSDVTDLDSSCSSSSPDVDVDVDPLIHKLEDAIHRIIVRRSAPDWLPFLPGASYWVPPRPQPSNDLAQLLHNLANPPIPHHPSISLTTTTLPLSPSSSYFIQGAAPHPVEVDTTSDCNSQAQSEDEEG